MRAFVNRDDLDFETAAVLPPTQEWELAPNPQAQLEYQTRFTKFQGVSSLTLHLPTCFNGDSTRMYARPHARGAPTRAESERGTARTRRYVRGSWRDGKSYLTLDPPAADRGRSEGSIRNKVTRVLLLLLCVAVGTSGCAARARRTSAKWWPTPCTRLCRSSRTTGCRRRTAPRRCFSDAYPHWLRVREPYSTEGSVFPTTSYC